MEKITNCQCDEIHGEAVAEAKLAALPEALVQPLANIFRILADPTRLRIVQALQASELCVCDLSAVLAMTQSAISHQLALLRQARLVKFRKEGKVVYYSLDDIHISELLRMGLDHVKEEGRY